MDGVKTDERLSVLASEWAKARQARLVETRAMNKHWCQDRARAEWDVGDEGRAPCYRLWADVSDDWCESCKSREPHFQAMKELRREERVAFRRLCAFIGRLKPARTADAVDPSANSTGNPSTRVEGSP